MLPNAYFLAKFCVDTAENEHAKNLQNAWRPAGSVLWEAMPLSAIAEDHLLSRAGQVGGVLQGEDGRAQGEVQGRGGRGRRLDEGAAKIAAARM